MICLRHINSGSHVLKTLSAAILPVNAILIAIGLLDLSTTLYWLAAGCAVEFNPIMAGLLHAGIGWFVLVKLATLAGYVGATEWYRRYRNPVFAQFVGRLTVIAYVAAYGISFCCVNFSCLLR
jgi:hypothetical protein